MKPIANSKEPIFATANTVKRINGIRIVSYYDSDGGLACVNVAIRTNPRLCIVCHNCCIQFAVNEDGTYTCSACGKFPQELLQQ